MVKWLVSSLWKLAAYSEICSLFFPALDNQYFKYFELSCYCRFFKTCFVIIQVSGCNLKAGPTEIFSLTAHDFSDSTNFREGNSWPLYHTQDVNWVLQHSWSGVFEISKCTLNLWELQNNFLACLCGFCLLPFFCFLNQVVGKSSATDIIQQLSGALLVRMIHTRDGSRIGMLCVKHGSAKVCHNWL